MTLELTGADEDSAVSEIATSHGELQEEFDTISEQVGLLAIENEKLQSTIKVLSSKASIQEETTKELEDQKEQLIEEVANLEAVNEEKFISSEQALVISLADKEINEEQAPFQNEFLNNEVMRFMPSSQN